MATGTAGDTARQYSTQQVHYLRKTLTYSDRGTTVTVGKVPAGAVILYGSSGAYVSTAFTGTGTDLLDIGISGNNDLFATDLDVSSVGWKALDENVAGYLVSSTTTVTAEYADQNSDAGAGSAEIVIAYIPDNDG